MPYLFILSGSILIIAAVRNTNDQLLSLLKSDFTGKGNFIYWLLSILLIGAIGYIPDLKPVSRAFLLLVIVVLFLKNGGVFTQFVNAIGTTQQSGSIQSPVSTGTNPATELGQLINL
jgi:hypothetical protein